MIIDEVTEAKVKLEALGHLLWFYKPIGTSPPDDFGWGLGMLISQIEKDLESIMKALEEENVKA